MNRNGLFKIDIIFIILTVLAAILLALSASTGSLLAAKSLTMVIGSLVGLGLTYFVVRSSTHGKLISGILLLILPLGLAVIFIGPKEWLSTSYWDFIYGFMMGAGFMALRKLAWGN